MLPQIALVLKGYPRLSETFIAQEILGLERAGLSLVIVSLRHPTDVARHPIHSEIRAQVIYLPEYLHQEPLRVWLGIWAARRSGCLVRILGGFFRDFVRDKTRNRVRRFGQAAVLAHELPSSVEALYAHYLHTPSSVTRYAASLRRLPFAISAHAKDIWTIPEWEIKEKLEDAAWLTTCTRLGFDHLQALAPDARLFCLPHGIDLQRLPRPEPCRDWVESPDKRPVELLTVARAVEKKGLDVLLDALSRLPADIDWRWRHVGGGPLLPCLRSQAAELGIESRVEWLGALAFDDVLDALQRADLFCFSPRTAADGDRDGIPNVIAEAMSQELAVVSAQAGAVEEIVEDGSTGLLVPPEDPDALATAIEALIRSPSRRAAMGRAGRAYIENHFAAGPGIAHIAEALGDLTTSPLHAR
jgi:glycosyltransferase involved in cell wall biosynthesis